MMNNQIFFGNSPQCLIEVGKLYLDLAEAINLIQGMQQPPACTDMDPEEEGQNHEDALRVKDLARQIYTKLTGENI